MEIILTVLFFLTFPLWGMLIMWVVIKVAEFWCWLLNKIGDSMSVRNK